MRVRPVTPQAAARELAEWIAERGSQSVTQRVTQRITHSVARRVTRPRSWLRVLVDGAPAAEPGWWADALVEPLRLLGRPVLRASATDFLRPASVRLEYGRHNPHSLLDGWYDLGALRRELLDPLAGDGSGRVLLRWWDEASDRSARADYVAAPAGAVLLLDGSLLLGAGLPVDVTLHLHLSEPALRRGTPPDQEWTLPAYQEYAAATRPEQTADAVLLVDHPSRPAIAYR